MKKIAILKVRNFYNNYDDYEKIIDKITDFTEVTDEVFDILSKAQYENGFSVIEVVTNIENFITNTVADYLAMVEKREVARKKAEEIFRKKGEETKRKKREAAEAKERKTLEVLLAQQVGAGRITKEDAAKILNPTKG